MQFPKNEMFLAVLLVAVAMSVATIEENDLILGECLQQKMNNFGSWIVKNNLDPFPPLEGNQIIKSRGIEEPIKVEVSCTLSDHSMSQHSLREKESVTTESIFKDHIFVVIRNSNDTINITAWIICNGKVHSEWYSYDELPEDVEFTGEGRLTFVITRAAEFLEVSNVGITENYKLNLNESYFDYNLYALNYTVAVEATWSDNRLNSDPFRTDISHEVGVAYDWFLGIGNNLESPPFQMLKMYLDDIASSLNLRDLMNEDELPEPHVPNPATTTEESRTTTETTVATSTDSTTESSRSNTAPRLSVFLLVVVTFVFLR